MKRRFSCGGTGSGCPVKRVLRALYLTAVLFAFGAGIGVLGLWIAASSYPAVGAEALFAFYWENGGLIILNVLPSVVLTFLGFFVFSRIYAGVLTGALPTLVLVCGNFFKIQLRNDPVIATDLGLLRTAGGIVDKYHISPAASMHLAIALCMGMLAFALLLTPRCRLKRRVRVAGAAVCAVVSIAVYTQWYVSDSVYIGFEGHEQLDPWSEVEDYVAHGCVYPFLHSIQDAISAPPEQYNEQQAEKLYAAYEDADIPEDEKVTVIGIMCEAFSDLSEFPALAEYEQVQEVYAPLHELEERSVSGRLLTNIFAGGTVDTEWCALTGYSAYETFRKPTDSYVWYFAGQGYDTLYQHPGYEWFYDREHVNEYLGFDESFFTEDGFGELVEPVAALFHSDGILVDYLLGQLDSRTEDDAPLFSFSVTYQNHGPYNTEVSGKEIFTAKSVDWTEETRHILNNYLYGVGETIGEMVRLTEELEKRGEPVVLFFFGDHKPWLGDDKSVYRELGVNLNMEDPEGFANYFATPYVIWANSAAKEALGRDFTGGGGDFSPCYLMAKVFDECAWEGPAFMQISREMRAVTPLLSKNGFFLQNGRLSRLLNEEDTKFYRNYLSVQYWREQHGMGEK